MLNGRFVPASTLIWGAGVVASSVGHWLGVETDRGGHVRIAPDLSIPGRDGIYALGDTTVLPAEDGKPLPALAQVAQQQGQHLGKALAANILRGEPMPPFRFKNRGNTAVIGRNAAVFDFGSWTLRGWLGLDAVGDRPRLPAGRLRKPHPGDDAVGVAVPDLPERRPADHHRRRARACRGRASTALSRPRQAEQRQASNCLGRGCAPFWIIRRGEGADEWETSIRSRRTTARPGF